MEKKNNMKVHAEIQYYKENGDSIHSDICPDNCDFANVDPLYKELLHRLLDEWLDNSKGSGMFYIAEEGFIPDNIDYFITSENPTCKSKTKRSQ